VGREWKSTRRIKGLAAMDCRWLRIVALAWLVPIGAAGGSRTVLSPPHRRRRAARGRRDPSASARKRSSRATARCLAEARRAMADHRAATRVENLWRSCRAETPIGTSQESPSASWHLSRSPTIKRNGMETTSASYRYIVQSGAAASSHLSTWRRPLRPPLSPPTRPSNLSGCHRSR
jgi:hypothetical protein